MVPNVVELVTVLSNSFPHFMAIVSHFLPSLPFFVHHFVNQCVSGFYGAIVKGAA